MQSLRLKMERLSLRLTPATLTLILVLVAAVPLHIPGAGSIMPAFGLISIYYWCLFLPGVLPYLFLFVLGLLQDALMGLPLGISPFTDIAFAYFISERRFFGSTLFGSVWLGFIVFVCIPFFLQWCLLSLYYGRLVDAQGFVLLWCTTSCAYPLMHMLFTPVHRMLAEV